MLVSLITQSCVCIFQPNLCYYLSYVSSTSYRIYKLKLLHKLTTEHTLHSRVNLSIMQNVDCCFLKLQNHTLNECTNPLYKFEENPWTEFFSILLQILISIFSYILNNGFHTATLN